MTRQTPRHRAWVGIGLVAGILAIVLGAWGLRAWSPFDDRQSDAGVFWPRNIAPLARFVQDHTGRPFLHPVEVEYIADPDAFETRTADAPPTDTQRATAAADAEAGRALGFWTGEAPLIEFSMTMRGAADFGAEWLPDEGTIVIRADDGEADLSALDRVELVVLLTEIVDDQHFDVARRLDDAPSTQEFQALLALHLGEALWVRDRYVDSLEADDFDAYTSARDERGQRYTASVATVPPVYRSLRVSAQSVGPAFVASLHLTPGDAIGAAFRDRSPRALDQVTMPSAKYFTSDATESVDPPPVPATAEFVHHRQMGPFALYLILSGGAAPSTALTASDGWGNDRYTTYRTGGRTCVDGRIIADSPVDADRMEPILEAWAAARPPEAEALVGRNGTALLLSVCDPGASAAQTTPSQAVLDQYFGRASLLADRVESSGQPLLSECVAISFYGWHDIAQAIDDPSFDYVGELDRADEACRNSV